MSMLKETMSSVIVTLALHDPEVYRRNVDEPLKPFVSATCECDIGRGLVHSQVLRGVLD